MANTIQIVEWALEMECSLRSEEGTIKSPAGAYGAIYQANAYSRGHLEKDKSFGIFANTYITSYTFPNGPKKIIDKYKALTYPANGFLIATALEKCNGSEGLHKMCDGCSANCGKNELASCAGVLDQEPGSEELENQLRRIINRKGLGSAVLNEFPNTKPLWYGLWAESPIPRHSLPVLKILIEEMIKVRHRVLGPWYSQKQIRDLSTFATAVDRADKHKLNLHVNMTPPGHTDCDIYSIFAHCPYCKAYPELPLWETGYPEQFTCTVCGKQYSPTETSSREREADDAWGIDLREQMDRSAYEIVAKEYLFRQKVKPVHAEAIVQYMEDEYEQRAKQAKINKERWARECQWLEAHLFDGLTRLESPEPELDDPEEGPPNWFDAPSMSIILERCNRLNARILLIKHHSEDINQFRYEGSGENSELEAIFNKWRGEGCNGKFFGLFVAPHDWESLL